MRRLFEYVVGVLIVLLASVMIVCGISVGNYFAWMPNLILISLVFPPVLIERFRKFLFFVFLISAWLLLREIIQGNGCTLLRVCAGAAVFSIALLLRSFFCNKTVDRSYFLVAIAYLLTFTYLASTPPRVVVDGKPVAYLERGKWGITHTQERSLNIRSQYSYSLIKKALQAIPISSLEGLESHSELWIVTPTVPFTPHEIERLRNWVENGGSLIVVTDHTDLFGHATVANSFLKPYGIEVGRDCVIDSDHIVTSYYSVIGGFLGLTANSIGGWCWPSLLQFGYKERVDYNGRSFFSDMAVTDEDEWGIWGVLATRRFGKGLVAVFGDSTLFADFAFSRPSSQLAFRMLRDRVLMMNVPLYLLVLVLVWGMRNWRIIYGRLFRWIVLGCVGFLFIKDVYSWSEVCKEKLFPNNAIQTQSVTGNWDLVDDEHSGLSVPFASCYAYPTPFPEWRGFPCHAGDVLFDSRRYVVDIPDESLTQGESLEAILQHAPSISVKNYCEDLLANSIHERFWFDSGVGIFREFAYSNFWNKISGTRGGAFYALSKQTNSLVSVVQNGVSGPPMNVVITEISGNNEWCVVGDWVLGKKVNSDILVRELWQHPARKKGDFLVQVVTDNSTRRGDDSE